VHMSTELWHELLNKLDDIQDLLNARQATPLLRDIVSDIIKSLKTSDFELPAKAWKVFERALAVVLSFDAEALQNDPEKYVKLLSSLPQRLLRVRLEQFNDPADKEAEVPRKPGMKANAGRPRSYPVPDVVIARLCASAFSATLQQLHMQPRISVAAATHVLRDLPSLHTLSMTVATTKADRTYKPSTSAPLTALHLSTVANHGWLHRQGMDVSNLAAVTTLRELHLEPRHQGMLSDCHGLSALSTLSQLTSFKANFLGPPTYKQEAASDGGGDDGMVSEPDSDGCELQLDLWPLLQQLPQLQEAEVPELYLRPATGAHAAALQQADAQQQAVPQHAQLRSLTVAALAIHQRAGAQGQRAEQQLQLSAFLPALTHLSWAEAKGSLLDRIAGHSHLRSLSLELPRFRAPGPDFWAAGGFLRSLPELQSLDWDVHFWLDGPELPDEGAAEVVADAAGCHSLRELSVVARDGLSVALCQQLAAGACTGLSSLYLQVEDVSLAMVAALVQGLKQLRRLEVVISSEEQLMEAVGADVWELQALLRKKGAAKVREQVVQLATAVADSRGLARAMVEAATSAGQQGGSREEAAAGQAVGKGKGSKKEQRERAAAEKEKQAQALRRRKAQEQVVEELEASAAALLPLLASQLGLPLDAGGGVQQGQQGPSAAAAAAAAAQGRGARRRGQQQQQQLAPAQEGGSGQQGSAALCEQVKEALLLGPQLLRVLVQQQCWPALELQYGGCLVVYWA
jgi:hypothetical protein